MQKYVPHFPDRQGSERFDKALTHFKQGHFSNSKSDGYTSDIDIHHFYRHSIHLRVLLSYNFDLLIDP